MMLGAGGQIFANRSLQLLESGVGVIDKRDPTLIDETKKKRGNNMRKKFLLVLATALLVLVAGATTTTE